jgi:putative CocE/NonD family hydrolase
MSIEEHRGPHAVDREGEVAMRTRDGVTLRADVYRPDGPGPFPVLVRRTPYGKRVNDLAAEFNEAHYFASHGYLVVVQDSRGRFSSEGAWYPFIYDALDGYDTVEWAAGLPGSSGRVGTFGQSYGCIVQYLTAAQRPPHLVTCVPTSGNFLSFENYWYHRGVLELGWMLSYFVNMAEETLRSQGRDAELAQLDDLKVDPRIRFSPLKDDVLRHLPINDWIERLGDGAPFLEDVIYHSVDGPYWWANDLRRQLHDMDVPMLHLGSWYDLATWDTPLYFNGLRTEGMSEHTRAHQAMFMGPWAHLLPYNQPTSGGTGDIDFGPDAAVFLLDMELAWFDHFLKGDGQGLPRPPVRIFVMGDNAWRDEAEWPLARTRYTPWYLHSQGAANTLDGDGTLSTEAPDNEPADHYRYDPARPVPTCGGHFVGGGVADQRANQCRPDVLVYTSAPLDHDMEITGPVTVSLHASTSAVDTDFMVHLSDVRPDGYAQNLVESVVRGRFRSSYTVPALMQPGEIYQLDLDLWNISHVLFAGHRLRVHVTSSDFPRWERNLNTGSRVGEGTDFVVADQAVYHDRDHPSHIVLPVIPR